MRFKVGQPLKSDGKDLSSSTSFKANEISLEVLVVTRTKKILELFSRGLNDSENCIGYHGTSVEAINYLLKNGCLPGRRDSETENKSLPQKGDFYFMPIREHLLGLQEFKREETQDPTKYAENYAHFISAGDYFLTNLNLDIENQEYISFSRRFLFDDDPEAEEFFLSKGFSKQLLDSAAREAKKRKGVIIGIHKNALDKYVPKYGDGGDDLRFSLPSEGLSYEYLSGIEPLGQEEWDYFIKIKESSL